MKELIMIVVCICALICLAFISGTSFKPFGREKSKEREIKDRILKTNKECLTTTDLEIAIWGESQL